MIFLDADDRLLPRAIESHLAFALSRPECGFVYGAYYDIDEIGRRLRSPDLRAVGNDPFRALLAGNMIGMHATAMYRRSCLDAIGGFDTNLDACEDIDVFLRMALRFPIACHAERIAEYRRHESNMSRSSVRMLRAALRMLAKHRQSARTRAEWWAAYCCGR